MNDHQLKLDNNNDHTTMYVTVLKIKLWATHWC